LEDHAKRFSTQKWTAFAALFLLSLEVACKRQDQIDLMRAQICDAKDIFLT
jgi:hypothetical protein